VAERAKEVIEKSLRLAFLVSTQRLREANKLSKGARQLVSHGKYGHENCASRQERLLSLTLAAFCTFNMSQNPVLPLVVLLFAIIVTAAIVGLFTASRRSGFAYNRVERLFSPAERSFLGVLEQILGTQYRVFGKIRLADIIQTPKGLSDSSRTGAFNRICARHVDFAVCDPRTFEIIGVIELDDSSHGRESRRKRDRFVDEALTAAGLPFVRIAAQRSYVPAEIREKISALFRKA